MERKGCSSSDAPHSERHRDVILILSCFSILSPTVQSFLNICASKRHITVNRTTEPHYASVSQSNSPSISEQQLPAFLFSFGASEMGKDGILNISFDPLPT